MKCDELAKEIQVELDAGYTVHKAALRLKTNSNVVNRSVRRNNLEIYVPFDEYITESGIEEAYNFEWLYGKDVVYEIFYNAFDGVVNLSEIEKKTEATNYLKSKKLSLYDYLIKNGYNHLMSEIVITCKSCKKTKPINEYFKNKNKHFLQDSECKCCIQKRSSASFKRRYKENPAYFLENSRRWALLNPKRRNEIANNAYNKRRSLIVGLPSFCSRRDYIIVRNSNSCYLTGEKKDLHLDHFIPLSLGHGGNYKENLIVLRSDLNISKNNRNPFEWINDYQINYYEKFTSLVEYLSKQSGMTVGEYESFINWCFENPRTVDEIKADNERYGYTVHSIELYREATGIQFPLPSYVYKIDEIGNRRFSESEAV